MTGRITDRTIAPLRCFTLVALCAVLCVLFATACAKKDLRPAPQARETPGRGQGAVETVAGVRVEPRVNVWVWTPRSLDLSLTPILADIINQSDRAVRLRFEEFELVDAQGCRFAAIPPFDTESDSTVRVPNSGYAYGLTGFRTASHLGFHFPHCGVHYGAFAHDRLYYDHYYPNLVSRSSTRPRTSR